MSTRFEFKYIVRVLVNIYLISLSPHRSNVSLAVQLRSYRSYDHALLIHAPRCTDREVPLPGGSRSLVPVRYRPHYIIHFVLNGVLRLQ